MQTDFTPAQLRDPAIAEADEILRRCVHCGLCNATCPTYVLSGDERDSPRGRISMIKHMLETGLGADAEATIHIDRCLSCLSCMTTCPSAVNYMHLVDLARSNIETTAKRRFKDRLIRRLLANLLTDPDRLRYWLRFAPYARPFAAMAKWMGLQELSALLAQAPPAARSMAPAGTRAAGESAEAVVTVAQGQRRKRVVLLAGCTQQVLRPEINAATMRLLARRGVDVEVAPGAKCCGALDSGLGRRADAVRLAKINVDAWTQMIAKEPVDAIIATASGCGTALKDYAHLLRDEPGYGEKAETIARLARDVTEFLADHDLGPPKRWSSLRIAYHSACSMRHGQRIDTIPRALLSTAGFAVAEVPQGHLCCGAAGAYNILQPDIAAELRDRKIATIESAKPDLVAAGNIGCITQLRSGMEIPIAHTVELLDWAYGGPVPRGLEELAKLVNDVPDYRPAPLRARSRPEAAMPKTDAGAGEGHDDKPAKAGKLAPASA